MSEETTSSESASAGTNGHDGSNGSGSGRTGTVVRAAALAAASGATALAAKKAFGGSSSSSKSSSGGSSSGGGKSSDGLVTTFLGSGWDSAKDTIVPMLEDAATHAGEYVARNAPEVVTTTIVPQFIRGFQRAQSSSDDDE